MSDPTGDSESRSRFWEFINEQLDLSGLDAAPTLSEEEIETVVMPLIRQDIHEQTLLVVIDLLRHPQPGHWREQLAPYHREIRACLEQALAWLLQQRFASRLSDEEWADVVAFVVTVAWLVRKQMDGDEPLPSEN